MQEAGRDPTGAHGWAPIWYASRMGTTPVWLTRSLVLMATGAVLALAVTVNTRVIDIQTTGAVLLCVGLFDLVLNVGLLLYRRRLDEGPFDY